MKLQNLSLIFIIIIIPIILVVSYYISMQIDTINMQTAYNTKILEATKEAIESFEINTVEWNSAYSNVANSKRRDVMASINTFTSSFANSIGVGGAPKETILAYVPAIAYNLYDGYYIYSPAETKEVIKDENETAVFMTKQLANSIKDYTYKEDNEGKLLYEYDSEKGGKSDGTINTKKNGETKSVEFTLNPEYAKTDYSHILKPFSSYSARYVNGGTDITVNYTLDNYVTIYGTVGNGEYTIRSGYLIDTSGLEINSDTMQVELNGRQIRPEILEEKVWYEGLEKPTKYQYIYASDNTKVYFDGETAFQVSSTGKKTNLDDTTTIKYKKLSILSSEENKYYEIYQALNGENRGKWYLDTEKLTEAGMYGQQNYNLDNDFSSINYYVESYCFTNWIKNELNNITIGNIQNVDTSLYGNEGTRIFDISNDNNPEKNDSAFSLHKREVIKQCLISNLNQAITSYSRNSEGEYKLPKLTETDWDKVLENVSIVAFVQGIPIGLKNYNNYAIATSTANKEYVNPDEIYITSTNDDYYHLPNCEHIVDGTIIGYRNTDYLIQSENDDNVDSYYKHENISREACYYCLVDRASYDENNSNDNVQLAYDTALGREKYNNRTTRMETAKPTEPEIAESNIILEVYNDGTLPIEGRVNLDKDGWYQITAIGGGGAGQVMQSSGGPSGAGIILKVKFVKKNQLNYFVGNGGEGKDDYSINNESLAEQKSGNNTNITFESGRKSLIVTAEGGRWSLRGSGIFSNYDPYGGTVSYVARGITVEEITKVNGSTTDVGTGASSVFPELKFVKDDGTEITNIGGGGDYVPAFTKNENGDLVFDSEFDKEKNSGKGGYLKIEYLGE